ncbi:galactose mutarotase isoform X1 [Ostrinia nubilalis]|uniref:galactose mutarotase isoform X1 n=2 Tax=Ostrinia nubilalis TaxID=29057 RepID=UPI0030823B44
MAPTVLFFFLVLLVSYTSSAMVTLNAEDFGSYKGSAVKKFTWTTHDGFSVSVISYGATIQSIKVPDRTGVLADVVLGFNDITSYVERNTPYMGATVGRCANRIGGANFTIDGIMYKLAKNIGENHLHGGIVGFNKVNWESRVEGNKVVFSYLSKDGEEGYPGDLVTNVIYEVREDNSLHVEFKSTTTKKTVVNLTNHSYFNLAGHQTGADEMLKHVASINANKITETDSESIPTGKFINVGGTPFDLRIPTRIGSVINKQENLFDDNFCVNTYGNKNVNFVARVVHPSSGRYLELFSDQPGVQFYTANSLPDPSTPALVGKDGAGYRRHGAFCLETQKYPDAVHHPNFPSAFLSPGDVYTHRVIYKFGAEKKASHSSSH